MKKEQKNALNKNEFNILRSLVKCRIDNKIVYDFDLKTIRNSISVEDFKSQFENLPKYLSILVRKGFLKRESVPFFDEKKRPHSKLIWSLKESKNTGVALFNEFYNRGEIYIFLDNDYMDGLFLDLTLFRYVLATEKTIREFLSQNKPIPEEWQDINIDNKTDELFFLPPSLVKLFIDKKFYPFYFNEIEKTELFQWGIFDGFFVLSIKGVKLKLDFTPAEILLSTAIHDYINCNNRKWKSKLADTIEKARSLVNGGNTEKASDNIIGIIKKRRLEISEKR